MLFHHQSNWALGRQIRLTVEVLGKIGAAWAKQLGQGTNKGERVREGVMGNIEGKSKIAWGAQESRQGLSQTTVAVLQRLGPWCRHNSPKCQKFIWQSNTSYSKQQKFCWQKPPSMGRDVTTLWVLPGELCRLSDVIFLQSLDKLGPGIKGRFCLWNPYFLVEIGKCIIKKENAEKGRIHSGMPYWKPGSLFSFSHRVPRYVT